MMKTVNRMFLTAAAASMAVMPVAAQANTRAGDSSATYSASAPGLGRTVSGEALGGEADAAGIILAILAAAAIIGGIIIASDSNDDGQSPGT